MTVGAGGPDGTRGDPSWGEAPRAPDEARAFFSRWIGHANGGDWDAFADLLHDRVELHDPMTAEPGRGRPEVLARCKQQYDPFPDGRIELLGDPFVALEAPELVYHWRFTGTNLHPVDPPGFAATGLPVLLDGASVLRFSDGKVVSVRLFFDTTAIARQLLAAPAAGSPLERVMALAQRLRVRLRRSPRGT